MTIERKPRRHGDTEKKAHSYSPCLRVSVVSMMIVAAVAAGVGMGCAATPGPSPATQRAIDADADLFAPIQAPGEIDPKKARLALEQIPDDPPASQPAAKPPQELPERAARHLAEARRLFTEHRYTETILEVEKALRYAPENPAANRLLALACLHSGSDGRAILSANRALAARPDDLASHYTLGRLADKAGDVNTALRQYRVALKCPANEDDAPYRTLTRYYLGVLLEKNGFHTAAIGQLTAFEEAIRALDAAGITDPELATIARVHRGSAALLAAGAHAKLGDDQAAADALAIATRQYPDDLKIRAEYVKTLVRAQRLDAAVREAERFVEDTQGDREAVGLLLAVHRRAGHLERGLEAVQTVARAQPDNVDLWLLYVDALLTHERLDDASRVLDELLERHPELTEAHWKRIALQRSRQQWRAWLVALAEKLALDPGSFARAAAELDQAPEPVLRRFAEQAVAPESERGDLPQPRQDGVAAALDYLLGRVCDRLDRVDDARVLFERSLARQTGFLPASLGVAEMYVRRCRWADALKVIDDARKDHDDPVPAFERLMGQCYDGLDQIDRAVLHYENAVRLDGADVSAMMLLGWLHERTNNLAQARAQYQSAIAAAPDNAEAREALVRNLIAEGATHEVRPDQQIEMLRESLRRIQLEVQDLQRVAPNDPATIRCLALLRLRDGTSDAVGPDDYVAVLRKLIEKDPADLRSRIDLAATYSLTMFDYPSALTQAEAILDRDPCSAEGNEIAAQSLMKLLRFDEAQRRIEQMLAWHPNRQSWLQLLAELHMIVQNYDAAIATYDRVRALPGMESRPLVRAEALLQAYLRARRYDDAYRLVDQWMADAKTTGSERSPSIVHVLREMTLSIDIARKDYQRQIDRCNEWLKESVQDKKIVRDHLLDALVAAKRGDEALAIALSWLADESDDDWVVQRIAEVLLSIDRGEEAAELARSELAAADKPDGRLLQMRILVQVYREAHQYDQEVAAIRDVLTFDVTPFNAAFQRFMEENLLPDYRATLGTALARAGRFDEAVEHLNKLLDEAELNDDKASLLQVLSGVYQRQRRPDLTEQRLREAHRLTPHEPGVNNDLGYTLADRGKDIAEAERMIRLAVGERPQLAPYLDSLGWVLYKKGDFDGAVLWLQRASTLDGGQDAVIFDHIGDAHWRLGRKDDAMKSWSRCVTLCEEPEIPHWEPPDESFGGVVKAKLEAARSGTEPGVAPLAKE